ncbi:MAG: lipoate--protein ligase family protein [Thermofilaceae archaeon]|nr:lipoate--protein ligase family protein [Thermofilaceae archaeon]MDW8004383.1 biotin/lipoate A/B protein ligase family protein [Thermofilaceae archaeon]
MGLRVLLHETPLDPFMNLAFEEAFVRARGMELVPDTLRIWRNANAVVIGYFQKAEEEVDLEAVEKLGAKVVRRFTGGGAVYHDLGNINYALAVSLKGLEKPIDYAYTHLIRGLLNALNLVGLEATLENVNDVVVRGRKVSGTAASIRWGACFIHGTLLVNTNLETLSRVLKPPREKLRSKGVTDVKYRVANIFELLGFQPSYSEIVESLVKGFEELLGVEAFLDLPSREEIKASEVLYKSKYSRREWNLERLPHSSFQEVEDELKAILRP